MVGAVHGAARCFPSVVNALRPRVRVFPVAVARGLAAALAETPFGFYVHHAGKRMRGAVQRRFAALDVKERDPAAFLVARTRAPDDVNHSLLRVLHAEDALFGPGRGEARLSLAVFARAASVLHVDHTRLGVLQAVLRTRRALHAVGGVFLAIFFLASLDVHDVHHVVWRVLRAV